MAKDPAFLFYTSDFLTGTVLMSNEAVGKYIRSLCILHQHGGKLPKYKLEKAVGELTEEIMDKFSEDKSGNLFNKRLLEESRKRENYCKSRSNNRLGKKHTKNTCKTHDKTYEPHMENENEDVNRDVYTAIIDNLNLITSSKYRVTGKVRELVKARMKEGFTKEDFFEVHRIKFMEWGKDEKMNKYLRPETLYSNKFDSYLNQKKPPKKRKEWDVI